MDTESNIPKEIMILIVDDIISGQIKRENTYLRNASLFALGFLVLAGLAIYSIFGLPDSQGKPIEIIASIVGAFACSAESSRYRVLAESEKTQRFGTELWKNHLE
jgi:hypothetical protein